MPLESSSLANWDGRISRGGQSREDAVDEFGRTRREDTDKDVEMDTNIPGLGQIPSRAQEDEEQVPGLNLSARVSTSSDSRASHPSPANSSNPDDLPSYSQSQRKYNALPHLPHRNGPSTSSSDNGAKANMTYAQHLRTSSNADLIPLGPKVNRKPAPSNTNTSHPSHSIQPHPPSSSNLNAIDKPQLKRPPTGPRADTKVNSHVNPLVHPAMKGLPPTGPRAMRPMPSSSQGLPAYPSSLSAPIPQGHSHVGSSTFTWQASDSGWPSRRGSAKPSADQREDLVVTGSRLDAPLEPKVVEKPASNSPKKAEKPVPLIKSKADQARDLQALEKLRKEHEPLQYPRVSLKPSDKKTLPKFKRMIQEQSISTGVQTTKEVVASKGKASTPAPSTSKLPPPVPLSSCKAPRLSTTPSSGRPRSPSRPRSIAKPARPKDIEVTRRDTNPLFTPPSDISLFTPPSSPLSSVSSPELARRIEPEEDASMLFSDEVQVGKRLCVCVEVPRLSKAERKLYRYRDEETLGAMSLIPRQLVSSVSRASSSSAIRRSSSSIVPSRPSTSSTAIQRSSSSTGTQCPSTSSSGQPSTSSCTPVQRKAKQKATGTIEHLQSETKAYIMNEYFELDDVVGVEEQMKARTISSPARASTSNVPVASTSTLPKSSTSKARAVAVNSGAARSSNPTRPSTSTLPGSSSSKAHAVADNAGCVSLVDALNSASDSTPKRKEKVAFIAESGKSVVDKGKGKARDVDDEVTIISVERAGSKKRKRVDGEGGNVSNKAKKNQPQQAHSTSSAKILTLEFEEAMDDEALYSVVKEPGAIDVGAAWNYEDKWATDAHVIGWDVLRRNLKGYRRVLLGNDDWYEEPEDEEEWDGTRSDMELESQDEQEVKIEKASSTANDEVESKRKGKRPVDIRDKLRMQRQREDLGLDMIVPLHRGDDEQHVPAHDGTINPALLGSVEADAIEYVESSDEEVEDEVVMVVPHAEEEEDDVPHAEEEEVVMAPPAAVEDGDVDAEADTDTDGEDDVPLSTVVAKRRATNVEAPQVAVPQIPPDKDVSGSAPPIPKPKAKGRVTISSIYPTRTEGEEVYCHQCRRKSWLEYMQCRNTACAMARGPAKGNGKIYCQRCIVERYDDYKFVAGKRDQCPSCEGICSCDQCTRKRGEVYVGPGPRQKEEGRPRPGPRKTTPGPRRTTPNATNRPSRKIKRPVRFVEEQAKEREMRKGGLRTMVTTRPGLLSGKTMWESVEKRIEKADAGPSSSSQGPSSSGGAVYWGEIYGAEHAVRVGSAWVSGKKRKFDGDGEEEDGGGKVYVQRKRVYVGAVVPEWGLAEGGREGPGSAQGSLGAASSSTSVLDKEERPKKRRRCYVGDPRVLTMPVRRAPPPAPTLDVAMDVDVDVAERDTKSTDNEQDFGTLDTESVLSELTPSPSPEPVGVGDVEKDQDPLRVEEDEKGARVGDDEKEGDGGGVGGVPAILARSDLIQAIRVGLAEAGSTVVLDLEVGV